MKKIENLTESYKDGETKWELDRDGQGQRQKESIRERETVNLTATRQYHRPLRFAESVVLTTSESMIQTYTKQLAEKDSRPLV